MDRSGAVFKTAPAPFRSQNGPLCSAPNRRFMPHINVHSHRYRMPSSRRNTRAPSLQPHSISNSIHNRVFRHIAHVHASASQQRKQHKQHVYALAITVTLDGVDNTPPHTQRTVRVAGFVYSNLFAALSTLQTFRPCGVAWADAEPSRRRS